MSAIVFENFRSFITAFFSDFHPFKIFKSDHFLKEEESDNLSMIDCHRSETCLLLPFFAVLLRGFFPNLATSNQKALFFLSDWSVENLQYLTSEQALADLANFIVTMNATNPELAGRKWIVFGGMYTL